jgi:Flp pilus assembly pilin Flp
VILRAVGADDSGQGLAEYGLILGFIAAVCLVVVVLIGTNLARTLTHVGSSL